MLRPTKVRQYLALMRSRGYSSKAVLAGSGISEAQLSDPTVFLDLEQCHKVISNVIKLTGNACIGFEFGRETQLTHLGIIGYAMASSSTLRKAVTLFFGYVNSSNGFPIHIELFENADGSWGITANESMAETRLLFRFYFEEIVGMGLALEPILTGNTFSIRRVTYLAALKFDAQLERLTGIPVDTEGDRTSVIINGPALDTPLQGNDDKVNDLCLMHCNNIMRRLGRTGTTASLVRSLLLRSRGPFALDHVAHGLNMSPRTLRRRLAGESTTFQALLDEFRYDMAREYLDTGIIPTKEIASRLGFSRVDAFRRAFKAWSGLTTRQYRGRPLEED